jgi:hypothetical protein
MKTRLSALLSVLTATAALNAPGLAGEAAAALTVIRPPPTLCVVPKLADCQRAGYLTSTCGLRHAATCEGLFRTEAQRLAAGQATRPAVLCGGARKVAGSGSAPVGTLEACVEGPTENVVVTDRSGTGRYLNGGLSLYENRLRQQGAPPGVIAPAQPALQLSGDVLYGGDGARSDTCDEYVYEAFYDYNRWEERLPAAGRNDPRTLVDAAFAAGGIGTRAIADRTGAAVPAVLPFRTCVPKNTFYQHLRPAEARVPELRVAGCHESGQPYAVESFAYHRDQSTRLRQASFTDAQLEAGYALAGRFGSLLSRLTEIEFATLDALGEERVGPVDDFGMGGFSPGDLAGLELDALEARRAFVEQEIEAALVEAEAMGCRPADPDEPTPCDWAPSAFLRILDGLNAARNGAASACEAIIGDDFAPVAAPRFRDENGNVLRTAAGQVRFPEIDYAATPALVREYMRLRPEYLRALREIYLNRLASELPLDAGGRRVRTDDAIGDAAAMGNENFGLTYSYEAAWGVTDFAPDVCSAKPYLRGELTASARVLGGSMNLVDARVDANPSVTGLDIALSLFGVSVYTAQRTPQQLTAAHTFNLVDTPDFRRELVPSSFAPKVTFFVLGVPVSVDGGLSAAVGLETDVDLALSATYNPQTLCLPGASAHVQGVIEPYASANAWARVYIDALVVTVGIKGILELVTARLPLVGEVGIAFRPRPAQAGFPAVNDVVMNAGARLDLTLRTLSGAIQLFGCIDLIFDELCAEIDLFRWSGPAIHETIFALDFPTDVALLDVTAVNDLIENN